MEPLNEKPSRSFYRPELDILRFFAFLLVFLHHGLQMSDGLAGSIKNACAFGVCIFYLLSSYLITELLEREQRQTGKIDLSAFYMRRILRIWPLYFAVLLFDFLLQHTFWHGDFSAGRLTATILLAGNWYVARHGFSLSISSPLWSISIEEQFYLLWPSVRKFFGKRASSFFSISTVLLASAVIMATPSTSPEGLTSIWVNSFVQFQFFGSGALLAFWLRGRSPSLAPQVRVLLVALALALLVMAQHFFHIKESAAPLSSGTLIFGYMLVNLGCCILFLSLIGARRLKSLSFLIYLGKISYGLYVYHWVCLRLFIRLSQQLPGQHSTPLSSAYMLPAFALTVGCAALSYRFFEAPILRLKQRFEIVHTRSI